MTDQRTGGLNDRRTDGPTDTTGYRDASALLKASKNISEATLLLNTAHFLKRRVKLLSHGLHNLLLGMQQESPLQESPQESLTRENQQDAASARLPECYSPDRYASFLIQISEKINNTKKPLL